MLQFLLPAASMISGLLNNSAARNNAASQEQAQKRLMKEQQYYNERNMQLQADYNKKAADYAFNKEHDFWIEQNKYNSPVEQMNRLRQAGINPALGLDGLQNTNGNMLDMSSPDVSQPSSPSGSASMSQTFPFPEVSSILMSMKQLQLLDSQIQTQKSNANYLDTLAKRQSVLTEKDLSGKQFWFQNASYDNETKYYNAKSLYQDIKQKLFRYNYMLPKELQKTDQEIYRLALENRFSVDSFKDRLNSIIYGNANIISDTYLKGRQAADLKSQMAYRDFRTTQEELTGNAYRGFLGSQKQRNDMLNTISSMHADIVRDVNKGNYLDAIKKAAIFNFLNQAANGSLIDSFNPLNLLPTPNNLLGGDIGQVGKFLFW